MIELPELQSRAEGYAHLPQRPLKITARLVPNTPVGAYDAVNLDNLLAAAVVIDAFGRMGLPDSQEPYALPLPLRCLWLSAEGLPLWAATCFMPDGESESDTIYWHKRAQTGRFTLSGKGRPMALKTVAGRWMERRVPLPATISHAWSATCYGNADEIARLLENIRFLGKKRSIGFGEIDEWEIQGIASFDLHDGERLLRPVPLGAAGELGGIQPTEALSLVGWTPPQWKPSLWAAGWRTGTAVQAV